MTPPTENASRHQQSQGPLDVPLEAEPVDLFSGPLWIQAEQLSWVSETTDEILASEIMESFVNNLLNHGIKLDCQAFRLPFILVQGSIASKIRIVALSQHLEQQSKEQQNMSIHAVPENGYEGEVIRIGITIKDTPLSKDPRRFLEHILNTRPLSIDITEEGVVVAVQYLYHARTNPISLSRRAGQHLKDLQALFPRSFPGSIKVTGYDLIGLTKVDPPTFHSGSQLHRWPFPNPSESASSNPAARSNVRPAPSNPAARSNVRTAPSTTAGLRERLNSSSLQPTGEKRARVDDDDDDDDDDEGQSVKLTSAAMLRGRASQLEKQARTWGEAAKLYEQSAMMVDEANKLCKQADQKLEGL